MKPLLVAFSTITLLILSAHRLPAPISEESPTPKPKAIAKKKASDEDQAKSREESRSKKSPMAKFVGVWTGNVTGSFTSDIGLNVGPTTTMTTLRVASDGTIQSNNGSYKAGLSPDGRTLTWPYLYADSNGTGRGGASLRLNDQKSAQYQFSVVIAVTGGGGNATMKGFGTLTKQ
jgi:hypothetical protein